jgi:hypothetical protein
VNNVFTGLSTDPSISPNSDIIICYDNVPSSVYKNYKQGNSSLYSKLLIKIDVCLLEKSYLITKERNNTNNSDIITINPLICPNCFKEWHIKKKKCSNYNHILK